MYPVDYKEDLEAFIKLSVFALVLCILITILSAFMIWGLNQKFDRLFDFISPPEPPRVQSGEIA